MIYILHVDLAYFCMHFWSSNPNQVNANLTIIYWIDNFLKFEHFSVIIMKGIKINSETRRLVYIERLFCSSDL